MTPFDDYREQVKNVLNGLHADGSGRHGLPSITNPGRYPEINDALYRLSTWQLYALRPEYGEREDVRTFVIWSTAAHLMRLTRQGNTLQTTERELAFAGTYMAANPDFVATSAFAQKLIRDLLGEPEREGRSDIRDFARNAFRQFSRMPPSILTNPLPEISEVTYKVLRHRNPTDFLAHPHLAPRWRNHISSIKEGRHADHAYWQDLAHGKRMVFSLESFAHRTAVFDSHGGQLTDITFVDDDEDYGTHCVSIALKRLARLHGDNFKLPDNTDNPGILKFKAATQKAEKQRTNEMKNAEKAWSAPAQPMPASKPTSPTQARRTFSFAAIASTWWSRIFAAMLLAYTIPILIVVFPNLVHTYTRAWSIILGTAAPCEPPAHHQLSNNLECVMPDVASHPLDATPVIPQQRSQP